MVGHGDMSIQFEPYLSQVYIWLGVEVGLLRANFGRHKKSRLLNRGHACVWYVYLSYFYVPQYIVAPDGVILMVTTIR